MVFLMMFDYDTTLFTKCDTVAMGVLAFLQIDSWKPLLTHFCPYFLLHVREKYVQNLIITFLVNKWEKE